jgi:hypothetical protein
VKIAEKTEPPFELKVPALRPGVFTLTVRTTDNLEAVAAAQCHITSSGAGTNRFLFPKYENGLFQAFFSAHYFDDFAIEAKSAQGNWNEIGRLTRTNFSGVIVDPNADGQSRLYRAVQISQ